VPILGVVQTSTSVAHASAMATAIITEIAVQIMTHNVVSSQNPVKRVRHAQRLAVVHITIMIVHANAITIVMHMTIAARTMMRHVPRPKRPLK